QVQCALVGIEAVELLDAGDLQVAAGRDVDGRVVDADARLVVPEERHTYPRPENPVEIAVAEEPGADRYRRSVADAAAGNHVQRSGCDIDPVGENVAAGQQCHVAAAEGQEHVGRRLAVGNCDPRHERSVGHGSEV